jgi:hypothetical protein
MIIGRKRINENDGIYQGYKRRFGFQNGSNVIIISSVYETLERQLHGL